MIKRLIYWLTIIGILALMVYTFIIPTLVQGSPMVYAIISAVYPMLSIIGLFGGIIYYKYQSYSNPDKYDKKHVFKHTLIIIISGFTQLLPLVLLYWGLRKLEKHILKLPDTKNAENEVITEDQAKKQAANIAENNVHEKLLELPMNYRKPFKNVRLQKGSLTHEFDSIVIGKNGIFNIETKNWSGSLSVKQNGEYTRLDRQGNPIYETKSPLNQVRDHSDILSNIMENKYGIINILCMANKNLVLDVNYDGIKILRIDDLTEYIVNYQAKENLSPEEIDNIMNKIEQHIVA
jgi:Nuclease-related domain.